MLYCIPFHSTHTPTHFKYLLSVIHHRDGNVNWTNHLFFRTACISREEKQKNMLQNGINTEVCKYNIKIQKIIFYFVVFFCKFGSRCSPNIMYNQSGVTEADTWKEASRNTYVLYKRFGDCWAKTLTNIITQHENWSKIT